MSLAPEDQLLLNCSRASMSDATITAAQELLCQNLDWDYVLEVSIRHGVAPLLYCGLSQVGLEKLIPARVMAELCKLYQGNRSRNQRLYQVIGELGGAFERAGISALGLKELQLAREVYPDIGMRPIGDIDILIHQEDYRNVAKCLAGLGFVPVPDHDIPFTLKYAWAHHFHRQADNVWLDIQWNIIQREWDVYGEGNFDFEIERMWRGAGQMSIDGTQILAPNPEDMLFHLCLHLEGHAYGELILFCDIVELLRHYEGKLDWDYIIHITKKYRSESSIYYVLFLTQRLFHISLPASLLEDLTPAYFKASLFEPLFGNLIALHDSLDEIRLSVAPPDTIVSQLEAVVRRQTVGAMQAYRGIDQIMTSFLSTGGSLIIPHGASSEMFFPDPALKPFEQLCLLILDRHLPSMHHALVQCGCTPRHEHRFQTYDKHWQAQSADPALAGRATSIAFQVTIERDLRRMLSMANKPGRSRKEIALDSFVTKLRARANPQTQIMLPITIAALSPEEMIVYLSAQAVRHRQGRLFALCGLLHFFRVSSEPLNWQEVARIAERYAVSASAHEGLEIARACLDDGSIPASALPLIVGCGAPLRILEWARYDPATWGRYAGFKQVFFFLFCVLSIEHWNAKCRYLFRLLFGRRGNKPLLLGVILQTVKSMVAAPRSNQRTTRDFAYWIDPLPGGEAEPTNIAILPEP